MELIKNPEQPEATDAKPAPQVNDISAPATSAPAEQNQPTDEHKPEPANDANVAPAPQNNDDQHPKETETKEADQPKPVKPPKPPRKHGSGGAIFAAVVIILALGAMFTYAYLRTQNIAVF
jgi:uncharacterized protein HemX